jgi:putative flippase GtrA
MIRKIKNFTFARYLCIGAVSAFAINIIIISGDFLGIHYGISLVLAFVLSTSFAYFAHADVTFRAAKSLAGFVRYLTTNLFGLGLTAVLLASLHDGLSVPILIASPVTTVMMIVYNFLSARWAIENRGTQA